MRYCRLLMMAVLLTIVGRTQADNLRVENVSLCAGQTKEVAIVLQNSSKKYEAFQFDMVLPEGITIAKDAQGNFISNLNEERIVDHSLGINDLGTGNYRFLSFSMSDAGFIGTDGVILYVTLEASENISTGTKNITIKSQVFTDVDGEISKWEDISINVTIEEPSTVTAMSYSREYGEDNPTFEYTVSGGALEGTPEITCEATATSPVGEYEIIISKGSVTNFNVTYVNGKLTINKAPLTITAKDYTIKQGEALPTFEATYEGFKNSETSAVLTKQPTISTTATSASEPGEYDITVSGAEAQNYEISYVKGKLTIQAQDLTPGDANGDGEVNVADVDYVIERIGEALDATNKAADVNDDGEINVADVDYIIERIV